MTRSRGRTVLSVRDMTYIAVSAILIAVCSWITIPAGPVPFTMQTFAVFTVVALLGWKRGLFSVLLYLLLGALGLPVFSGFGAGIAKILGPTGGYMVGFAALCLVYGLMTKNGRDSLPKEAAALALGCLVCYALGTAWFMVVYTRSNGGITLLATLSMCVFPFIIPDAVKLALSLVLVRRLRRAMPQLKN